MKVILSLLITLMLTSIGYTYQDYGYIAPDYEAIVDFVDGHNNGVINDTEFIDLIGSWVNTHKIKTKLYNEYCKPRTTNQFDQAAKDAMDIVISNHPLPPCIDELYIYKVTWDTDEIEIIQTKHDSPLYRIVIVHHECKFMTTGTVIDWIRNNIGEVYNVKLITLR